MRLDHVWLRYRRWAPWVLRDVTAHLDKGEAATVTGRNGAGKSTLLQLVAGLLRAQQGDVVDRPGRIGYVPERFPSDQPFSARRYLTAMATVHGLSRAEAAAGVGHWAERLHFTSLLDIALPELSKGSAQKVGLIQAMLSRPDLLILDEPWEGLDAQTRAQIPLIIAEVTAVGGRVLVSDHLGHTAELPGMRRWDLVDGGLVEGSTAHLEECLVEVAVKTDEVPHAVASLRAAGHNVVNVRARLNGVIP